MGIRIRISKLRTFMFIGDIIYGVAGRVCVVVDRDLRDIPWTTFTWC